MRQIAPRTQAQFGLTVLNGSDKGATYQLFEGRVRLGRGSENDIVIKDDPKVSRNHAMILVNSQGVKISDVSDRNKVIVNGDEIRSTNLTPGCIVQLGNTKFQFKSFGGGGALEAASQHLGAVGFEPAATPLRRSSRSRSRSGSKTNFYILVGVIAALFVWLLTSNDQKKSVVEIRDDEDVQSDILESRKIVEEIEAEKTKLGLNSRQYEEAQPNFIKGFRDYRKGQYERAIESFQACLSLFPAHIQCQRYLRLSQKKFSELVQYHMILANKYRSQNQYSACQASYRNVMVMLKNPTDKTYVEAKAGFEACKALEGDRY